MNSWPPAYSNDVAGWNPIWGVPMSSPNCRYRYPHLHTYVIKIGNRVVTTNLLIFIFLPERNKWLAVWVGTFVGGQPVVILSGFPTNEHFWFYLRGMSEGMNGFLRRRLAGMKKTHPIVTQSMTMLVAHVERNLYAHLKLPFFRRGVFFYFL